MAKRRSEAGGGGAIGDVPVVGVTRSAQAALNDLPGDTILSFEDGRIVCRDRAGNFVPTGYCFDFEFVEGGIIIKVKNTCTMTPEFEREFYPRVAGNVTWTKERKK